MRHSKRASGTRMWFTYSVSILTVSGHEKCLEMRNPHTPESVGLHFDANDVVIP